MASQLDLNNIRTFVAVAQAGTLSAAARDLGLPTSTVSRSITRLEQSLGLLLVQRSPRVSSSPMQARSISTPASAACARFAMRGSEWKGTAAILVV